MMADADDVIRQAMIAVGVPQIDLDANTGPTWDTEKLVAEFEVISFAAPFVKVKRKSDGATGTLEFTHRPRVYFNFVERRL